MPLEGLSPYFALPGHVHTTSLLVVLIAQAWMAQKATDVQAFNHLKRYGKGLLVMSENNAINTENTDAEGNAAEGVTQEPAAQEVDEKLEAPKYTDADVDRIIDQKFAKFKIELEKKDEERAQAVAEVEKLAKMDAEEKATYEQEQQRKKYEEMQAKLAELEQQSAYNAMSKQAATMLAKEKITVDDAVLNMVVNANDAEQTQSNIKAFSKLVRDQVAAGIKAALAGEPPKTSANSLPLDEFQKRLDKYK